MESATDFVFPHKHHNYQLNSNVERVYHALAIDDERKTFHPKVWTETSDDKPQKFDQVWFAGAHSNVGGGYPRAGLSNVTLHWMMVRAKDCGILFKPDVMDEVERDANVFGRLYDARDGLALYYRYSPRDIQKLCNGRLKGAVKIHNSVFDRLQRGTARYAPAYIPDDFEIVETDLLRPNKSTLDRRRDQIVGIKAARCAKRGEVEYWVRSRQALYQFFVLITLVLIIASLWFLNSPPQFDPATHTPTGIGWLDWLLWQINDVMQYALPKFVEDFVTYIVIVRPWSIPLLAAVFLLMRGLRKYFRYGVAKTSAELRRLVV